MINSWENRAQFEYSMILRRIYAARKYQGSEEMTRIFHLRFTLQYNLGAVIMNNTTRIGISFVSTRIALEALQNDTKITKIRVKSWCRSKSILQYKTHMQKSTAIRLFYNEQTQPWKIIL